MTTLYATYQTNLDTYNLNYWYPDPVKDEFRNDTYEVDEFLNVFEDSYFLYVGSDALALYGNGFEYYDPILEDYMYFGTIEGLGQWAWVPDASYTDGGYWEEGWHWTGWDLGMPLFYNTADTPDVANDLELIAQVMNDADTVFLSEFDDSFRGFQGDDSMFGGDGFDTIAGNGGDDFIFGGGFADVLDGGHGSDILGGGGGRDLLDGGTGNDLVKGGAHADVLDGGTGNDTLEGANADDDLFGNDGRDKLFGGLGDDTLRGGADRDVLDGGRGMDTFQFRAGDDKDVIAGFDTVGGVQDVIDLSDLAFVTDFNDLVDNYMAQVNNLVVMDFGDGDKIVLRDTDIGDLDASNFLFFF